MREHGADGRWGSAVASGEVDGDGETGSDDGVRKVAFRPRPRPDGCDACPFSRRFTGASTAPPAHLCRASLVL